MSNHSPLSTTDELSDLQLQTLSNEFNEETMLRSAEVEQAIGQALKNEINLVRKQWDCKAPG